MKQFNFQISYETRTVVINGTATVSGDYDGPSKPEAMVRAALGGKIDDNLQVTLISQLPGDDDSN